MPENLSPRWKVCHDSHFSSGEICTVRWIIYGIIRHPHAGRKSLFSAGIIPYSWKVWLCKLGEFFPWFPHRCEDLTQGWSRRQGECSPTACFGVWDQGRPPSTLTVCCLILSGRRQPPPALMTFIIFKLGPWISLFLNTGSLNIGAEISEPQRRQKAVLINVSVSFPIVLGLFPR